MSACAAPRGPHGRPDRPGPGPWLAGLALALAGCSLLTGPEGGFNLISVEEEWRLGVELEAEIARQMEVVDDRRSLRYLETMGSGLLAASTSPLAARPWSFHLVADDAVNAFNIPGGHVYVNTGLVAALDDHAQLASVMGHEIGHGLDRHGTQQMSAQYGFSLLASLVLGEDPSTTKQIIADLVTGGTLLKFSREDELDADRTGIRLMYGAGIDPQGAVAMLGVLQSLQKGSPSRIEKFLASHPMPAERVDRARDHVAALPLQPGLVRQTDDFLAFKRRAATLR